MIKKFLEAKVKSIDAEEGTFEVVASSGKVDRLGDTIDPKGWYLTNYRKNPIILWSHSSGGFGMPAIPPVSQATKVWVEDEKELMIRGVWADTPFARELRTLVEGGFLRAMSVGFLPLVEDAKGNIEIETKMYRRAFDAEIEKGIYGNGEKFSKQELLEVSWVNVPALAGALVSARKMNLALVTKALEELAEKSKCPACEIIKNKKFSLEDIKDAEEITEIKPYPNEHSCRLNDPGKYKRFRRKKCEAKHDGKCIDYIYGVTDDETVELQAMRYPKDVWTEGDARSHCKDHDGSFEAASGEEQMKENKILIENCIAGMKAAISSLEELVKSIPIKTITSSPQEKGRTAGKPVKSKITQDKVRLLRIADKAIGELLRRVKAKI